MGTLHKKVCMLGSFGVGKTSLVKRFVESIFSEKYHSTIGVKIDKKTVTVEDQELVLILWDIAGEDGRFSIPPSYLKGMSGYLLVIDGTRRETLDTATDIHERAQATVGDCPFVIVVNKKDLTEEWVFGEDELESLRRKNWQVILSSAKLGTGVEEAFENLARAMLAIDQ